MNKIKLLLLLLTSSYTISLLPCQGYRYIPCQARLKTEEEVLAYQALLHSCKMIKQNMRAIADHRLLVEDAVETSITLYLQGIPGEPAKVLLEDIKRNGFNL